MSTGKPLYAQILLPLALDNTYTYEIPAEWLGKIAVGMRVEVQFGSRKRYAGLITSVGQKAPEYKTKAIISVLDKQPVVDENQLRLWAWIASYYCCTLGEVMRAALPGGYLLSSETVIKSLPDIDEDQILALGDPLYAIMRLVQPRQSITLAELEKSTGLQVLYPHIVRLYQLGMIVVVEELAEKYAPKRIRLIQLASAYQTDDGKRIALELIQKSEKQTRLVLSFLSLQNEHGDPIEPKLLLEKADVGNSVLAALLKKEIFTEVFHEVNRMEKYGGDDWTDDTVLTPAQEVAKKEIEKYWEQHDVVLLHGVTGSGKTLIYAKIIQDVIASGGQVLYMVPEIGLSVQILKRLKTWFGPQITVSHSRLTDNERVDLWQQVMTGVPIVAGVRSSLFLPFQNLKLIIVDEEHDGSYKQQDPNPRYHGRDVAIVLANTCKAKVLLGSATPSLESYYHSESKKYGRVELHERFQGMVLPGIQLIDKSKDKSAEGAIYSHTLVEAMKQKLAEKKQIIIYKNRRGYAPVLTCGVCEWVAECDQCDIALTYHKARNVLSCHICGSVKGLVTLCPACGSPRLVFEGHGTEKIEDELSVIFPDAKIKRMDLDTTRGKHNMEQLIYDFEQRRIDILVGTQMVTKGLDFDHVGLVGVIYADQALHFPDFRATERTFQTLVQVSGRAGRKHDQGLVMIQTYQPNHPVLLDVVDADYKRFYAREIQEREIFRYPPFVRQIAVTIRHKKADLSHEAAQLLVMDLQPLYGKRVLGPAVPSVSRVRNLFIHVVYIKIERDAALMKAVKQSLKDFQNSIVKKKSLSSVRVSVDVDPQF